jgi:hypothetical protein
MFILSQFNKGFSQIKTSFVGRLLVVIIVFLVPTSILTYAILATPYFGFIEAQISRYLIVIVFLVAYLALIKLLSFVLRKFTHPLPLKTSGRSVCEICASHLIF